MSAIKTYILAPNFSYHPNTSICIGDIVQDPSDPTKPLSGPPDPLALNTESHLDYNAKLSKHETHSLNGSIWAKFLETVNTRISGGVSDDVLDKYTMDRLETIYYKKQPTDEEATERVKHNKVKSAINSGVFGKKPVYIITGLKVARGFRLESRETSTAERNTTLEVPVSSKDGVGADISLSSTGGVQQYHRSGQDIIFAYQLHIVKHKGWRQKDVDISVYKPKAAFLNEDGEVVEEELV
jgi:hypothetical protein